MREILFRGKDKENGKWITGFLVSSKHIGDWVTAWPVDPKTVGQFTGLTDKNCKKIFEGDIITFGSGPAWPVAFDMNAFVAMDGHRVQFALFEQYSWDHKTGEPIAPDYIEVIGNIHDNPELLEVSQ